VLEFAEQTEDYAALARPVDLVQGALALLHDTLSEQHIAVAVDVPEDIPQIRCSSNRLQQVLVNLLTNAREALNEKCPKRDVDKKIRITAGVRLGAGARGQKSEVREQKSTLPTSALPSKTMAAVWRRRSASACLIPSSAPGTGPNMRGWVSRQAWALSKITAGILP
jgi:hypothetical protein